MQLQGGGIERVLGPQLQKIYKTNPTQRVKTVSQQDVVTISFEAQLVQKAREAAAQASGVRPEVVAQAKAGVESGSMVSSGDLAAKILQRSLEQQV